MNFWEKVMGSDITSAMQSYAERMYGLSEDYAAVWDEIVRCLYAYTDFTGRNILPVLDGLADWLEAAAVDGKSVREVLGEDIESFCSALGFWRRAENQPGPVEGTAEPQRKETIRRIAVKLKKALEEKREWRRRRERVKKLPWEYRVVFEELENYMYKVCCAKGLGSPRRCRKF